MVQTTRRFRPGNETTDDDTVMIGIGLSLTAVLISSPSEMIT